MFAVIIKEYGLKSIDIYKSSYRLSSWITIDINVLRNIKIYKCDNPALTGIYGITIGSFHFYINSLYIRVINNNLNQLIKCNLDKMSKRGGN